MEERSLLTGDYAKEDDKEENLRPLTLKDFQGQEEIKGNLAVFIRAAIARKESLDHVFLSGPPGLGKTTLAGIMAREMGADFKVTSAPALEKPKDLAGILTTITASSVFFIDEIHRLKPALEEMLYTAMEDFEIDWIIGQGPTARTIRIPIPRFTLIGATTKAGRFRAPFTAAWDLHAPQFLRNRGDTQHHPPFLGDPGNADHRRRLLPARRILPGNPASRQPAPTPDEGFRASRGRRYDHQRNRGSRLVSPRYRPFRPRTA
jgi:DNA polymerase III delta prime subunit